MRWLVVFMIACGAPAVPARLPVLGHDDTQLQIADREYEQGHIEYALITYRTVRFPVDDERGWYARYKAAWCLLRLGERDRAIAEMTAVAGAKPNGRAARDQLRAAAAKDLASWRDLDADPTYLRADALYARRDFCAAAPLYAEVARGDTRNRDEAAYTHVLATISCEHLDDKSPDASPAWQRVLAAIDLYAAHASAVAPAVRFKRGQILYAAQRFADAAGDFRTIVRDAASDETAPYAAALLLDCDVQAHADLAADLPVACALHADLLDEVCRGARLDQRPP